MKVNSNAELEKEKILPWGPPDGFAVRGKENNKAGVYRWVNLITGKSYVGSSQNLSDR